MKTILVDKILVTLCILISSESVTSLILLPIILVFRLNNIRFLYLILTESGRSEV